MADGLPAVRRQKIVEQVRAAGAVRVSELAEELGVSDMTVRRDLNHLVKEGELHKVHGGARLQPGSSADEPGFRSKSELQLPEKAAIAAAAATLVEPGMSVSLTSGTTTFALARALRQIPEITVVTNSPRIADVLQDAPARDQTVLLTGGLRTVSDALVGPLATAALRSLHVDRCFMGVHGLSMSDGLTTPNMMEVEVNELFLQRSDSRVVLADSSKWGMRGLYSIAPLDSIDTLITDTGLADSDAELIARHVHDLRLEKP